LAGVLSCPAPPGNGGSSAILSSPIQDGWNQGDRGIQRTVYDPNDSQLTASLKGANR
jgi:hypothetical protein